MLLATVGVAVLVGPAFGMATAPNSSTWSGYATASTVHVNALQLAAAGPVIEDTSVAFSGSSVNSTGQSAPITNEMGLGVQSAKPEREAYGRGSGLEVGIGKALPNNPDTNQVILGALGEAGALPLEPAQGAPNPYQTPVVTKELVRQSANPLIYASVLRGQAQATWHDKYVLPMLGSPLGFGLGYADDVQLLNAGAAGPDGLLSAPVIATDTSAASGERTTSQSWSSTYLINNGDGTCGLASETRQTIAPIRLNVPPDTNAGNDTVIEVLGEWRLIATATGKPGGSKVEYVPVSGGPSTPVLRIISGSTVTNVLTTEQFFGKEGLALPAALAPLLSLAVGEDARAIVPSTTNPDPASKPTTTDTEASGAVDVLRLRLLQPTPTAAGLNALDLRIGHMETKVTVPAGGINCEIPVTKTVSPDPAIAGDDVTFTISIPSDDLVPFPCEMTAIGVEDTVSVAEGSPTFTVTGGTAPNGSQGVVSGNTVTFEHVGSWKPGDPPLLVTVTVKLSPKSAEGKLKDVVNVVATPSNCKARADAVGRALGGDAFLGGAGARLTGGAVTGGGSANGTLRGDTAVDGPTVQRPAELPKTGRSPETVGIASVAMIAAVGLAALRRRTAQGL